MSSPVHKRACCAEESFREAFCRLKDDRPRLLPQGSPVSQNNVAREAGKDPSALKKQRFPELIEEIKRWTASKKKSAWYERSIEYLTKENALLASKLADTICQRDHALSLLLSAEMELLKLRSEDRLRIPVELSSRSSSA